MHLEGRKEEEMRQGQDKGNKKNKHTKDESNELINKQSCPRPQREGI
jgi:hypothetical protein